MKPRITFDSLNSFNKTIDFDLEVYKDDEIDLVGVGREAIGGDGKASQFTLQYLVEMIDLEFNWQETDVYNKVSFGVKITLVWAILSGITPTKPTRLDIMNASLKVTIKPYALQGLTPPSFYLSTHLRPVLSLSAHK